MNRFFRFLGAYMALILPFVFIPLPTCALPYRELEAHSFRDAKRYPVLSRIRTFDDAVALIRSIEKEELDPRCTDEELRVIVKFITFSAKVGSLFVHLDEEVLNRDIQALLDEVGCERDYSFSKPMPMEEVWGYAKTNNPKEWALHYCSLGGFWTDVKRAGKGLSRGVRAAGRFSRDCGDAIVTGIAVVMGAAANAIASADVHDLPNVSTNENPLTAIAPGHPSERMQEAQKAIQEQERLYLEEQARLEREKELTASRISDEQVAAAKELGLAIATKDLPENSDLQKQLQIEQIFGDQPEASQGTSAFFESGTAVGIALAVPAAVMAVEAAPLLLIGSVVAVATYVGHSAYESGVAGAAVQKVSDGVDYVKSSLNGLFYGSEGTGLPEKGVRLPEPNVESGNRPDRQGYTKAGRSGQKHGGREGSVFPKPTGDIDAINRQGQEKLEEIVNNPASTRKGNKKGGVDISSPDGKGARFDKDGNFTNFLEP